MFSQCVKVFTVGLRSEADNVIFIHTYRLVDMRGFIPGKVREYVDV